MPRALVQKKRMAPDWLGGTLMEMSATTWTRPEKKKAKKVKMLRARSEPCGRRRIL